MPNYEKAFDLLTPQTIIGKNNLKNLEPTFDKPYMFMHKAFAGGLTEDEYNCVKDCLDAEPDSLVKIVEDFKKLGYKLNYYQKLIDNTLEISFSDKETFLNKDIYIKANLEDKDDVYVHITDEIFMDDLRLVNRVLKVWGFEVC